jgi:homoserine kinase
MVRVPATSANLGPGFDAIGMAVDIWNEITVERSEKFELTCEGEGVNAIKTDTALGADSDHLVLVGLKKAFEYAGETPLPPVRIHTRNLVPICSGFGSSSSAIVGGLLAGLILTGKELRVRGEPGSESIAQGLDPEELLHLAVEIEGHPDNVAPAIYGGIQLSVEIEEDLDFVSKKAVMSRRVPIPSGLRLVAYVPGEKARTGFGLDKTGQMRGLLKPMIPRADAVVNIQRTALLIDALHRGDLKSLRFATRDRLHQPMRAEHKFPHLNAMCKAALDAGAHGAFLSGAGPTVMAICSGQSGDVFSQRSTERQEGDVSDAMKKALEGCAPEVRQAWGGGKFYIVSPTDRGAHVVMAEPKFSSGLATFGSLDGSL